MMSRAKSREVRVGRARRRDPVRRSGRARASRPPAPRRRTTGRPRSGSRRFPASNDPRPVAKGGTTGGRDSGSRRQLRARRRGRWENPDRCHRPGDLGVADDRQEPSGRSLSPDGRFIVYSQLVKTTTSRSSASGSTTRRGSCPSTGSLSGTASPLVARRPGRRDRGDFGRWTEIRDLARGRRRQGPDQAADPETDLVLDCSRDGAWLATRTIGGDPFITAGSPWSTQMAPGARHLTEGSVKGGLFTIFRISPDGRSIAYVESRPRTSCGSPGSTSWTSKASTGARSRPGFERRLDGKRVLVARRLAAGAERRERTDQGGAGRRRQLRRHGLPDARASSRQVEPPGERLDGRFRRSCGSVPSPSSGSRSQSPPGAATRHCSRRSKRRSPSNPGGMSTGSSRSPSPAPLDAGGRRCLDLDRDLWLRRARLLACDRAAPRSRPGRSRSATRR